MSHVEDFLTPNEEAEIVEAIRKAEQKTSGEIRVHIEAHTDQDPYKRAMEVFHLLKMDNTKEANGVLIYIAVDDKTFVIYGDKGINDVVPFDFWNTTKNQMVLHFKTGQFKDGIIAGIMQAGKELQVHFPWSHQDKNELPNNVSKGKISS